ncbi:transglutaminase family protein [Roseospirillum parvum]|uniref:Transglutaminase-like enzyme, putative cysteine protease n=1 Tax=Roseospirillum parvum TaxID=83401 RepID=A0A1G8F4Y5_9PROT|nr:transglutaminase family protein [Roseospirillum parvum]SDH77200.1 Transglutaminase-like enzyme, putative cysteine protease [Roseospirillum parvum]
MNALTVRHRTTYRYREPMAFGPHRLMLRPRESRTVRLHTHDLEIAPAATVTWAHDVAGNAVATATFGAPADTLVIDSLATLTLDVEQWPVFDIAASAVTYPFLLSDDDMTDLGALRLQAYLDSGGHLHDWARGFVAGPDTDTLSLLKDISNGVAARIAYEARDEETVQTPVETLARGRGSCRDFAVLFVDAVRSLGFGARIVSGYLYDPDLNTLGSAGSGSTHAWAEVYVPGAGWIVFDPTNRSVGGFNLIPVAVARHIRQTAPVSGRFVGPAAACSALEVAVSVEPSNRPGGVGGEVV